MVRLDVCTETSVPSNVAWVTSDGLTEQRSAVAVFVIAELLSFRAILVCHHASRGP